MKNCLFDEKIYKGEIKRAFQGGQYEALFSLVDSRRISLSEAAQYAGLSMEEAGELFESWKWFRAYEGGGS